MKVIISDIDGTVLDVEDRIDACLREIGIETRGDKLRISRTLPRKQRDRFYDLFLANTYLPLDKPIPAAVEQIRLTQRETALPLVYLSGRLMSMQQPTRKALEALGLPFEAMLLRPMRERLRPTAEWKVAVIQQRGYEPAHIYDDDDRILAALGAAFPDATLHDLNQSRAVPGGG